MTRDTTGNGEGALEAILAREEWRSYADIATCWYDSSLCAITGTTQEHIDQVERRIGHALPACLREWYRLVAMHASFHAEHDGPIWLDYVRVERGMLRIYTECQEGWCCGVLERDLNRDGPPIHIQVGAFDLVQDSGVDPARLVDGVFLRVTSTLTNFVRAMLLRQTVLQMGPAPFLRSGVCGATFRTRDAGRFGDPLALCGPFGLSPALAEFPPGILPYSNSNLIIAAGTDTVLTRTLEHLDAVDEFAQRQGAELVERWVVE